MNGIKFADEVVAQKKIDMIVWLEESVRGTFIQACEHVGISRALGYQWVAADAQFKVDIGKAREKACESGLDACETALMEAIKAGNIAGIIFYLKTQGRARGFIEKVALETDPNNPLQVNHVHDATRSVREILQQLADTKASRSRFALTLDATSAGRTDNAGGKLADVVDNGGAGLGKN